MATRVWNIFSLRAGSMGSMRAWLPSRRSTAHQRGATVSRLSGQVRSPSSTGTVGWYLSNGMGRGVAGSGRMVGSALWERGWKTKEAPGPSGAQERRAPIWGRPSTRGGGGRRAGRTSPTTIPRSSSRCQGRTVALDLGAGPDEGLDLGDGGVQVGEVALDDALGGEGAEGHAQIG